MADGAYDTIADVYEYLVPDALLSPRGRADAFAEHVAPGARALDCSCGTGTLAVGLALRGHDAVQTHRERVAFWPFTEDELPEDLRDAGQEPQGAGVPADKAGRYLVSARRLGG